MSGTSNYSDDDQFLSDLIRKLESRFDNQNGFADDAISELSLMRSRLAYKMANQVAQLVIKGESDDSVRELLKRNFPSGVSIGNAEEILKLIYVGPGVENLLKAINFVQVLESSLQSQAYQALYEDIQFKQHTDQPEMLLLQYKITSLDAFDKVTLFIVNSNCCLIIRKMIMEILGGDYSSSISIVNSISSEVLNHNMAEIVHEFFTGTLESALLLLQCSLKLPNLTNRIFLIKALLSELQERQLMQSQHALHLWAHANRIKSSPGWSSLKKSDQQLCIKAIEQLCVEKQALLQHYQKYVEDADKQKIRDLHLSNKHLKFIMHDFVSFYYNGDVVRTQNLLAAANSINKFYYSTSIILIQLHVELTKSANLNSFEEFRLFHLVRKQTSGNTFKCLAPAKQNPYKELKENAPACVQHLLWPEGRTEFQVVNKFFGATLGAEEDNNNVVCFGRRPCESNHTWSISIDPDSSLVTLTHVQKRLELSTGKNYSPCIARNGSKWRVKSVDQNHLKIFCGEKGAETFLAAEEISGMRYHNVLLRKENHTDMQLWKLKF